MLGTQDGMRLDATLLDHWIPDFDTSRLITDIRERRPGLPFPSLPAHNNVAVAVEAMRAGATDFPLNPHARDRRRAAPSSAVYTFSYAGALCPPRTCRGGPGGAAGVR